MQGRIHAEGGRLPCCRARSTGDEGNSLRYARLRDIRSTEVALAEDPVDDHVLGWAASPLCQLEDA